MTDFKADIESRARTSTVRFSLVSFGTNVDDTIALDDDLQKTITDTNKIVYSSEFSNHTVRQVGCSCASAVRDGTSLGCFPCR